MSDLIVARNGRWVLASNGMPVLIVRSWYSAASVRKNFPGFDPPITDEEYAACAEWPFPPITDTAVVEQGDHGRLLFVCRCGEWAAVGTEQQRCSVCGRTYRLRVEEVTDGK